MCRVLYVSKSAFYAWLHRPVSNLLQEDEILKPIILNIFNDSLQKYGARRIRKELLKKGHKVSRARAGKLMKSLNLKCKAAKKYKATTNSKHSLPVYPNLLNREFNVSDPNKAYVGDITYIWTEEGWLYLAVLIDLYSNQRLISKYDFQCSMSRKGNCWDNAPAESFFKTFKSDLIYHARFKTREEAEAAIFEYIEVFYNRQRQHSSLDYLTPVEYEEANAA